MSLYFKWLLFFAFFSPSLSLSYRLHSLHLSLTLPPLGPCWTICLSPLCAQVKCPWSSQEHAQFLQGERSKAEDLRRAESKEVGDLLHSFHTNYHGSGLTSSSGIRQHQLELDAAKD